MQKKEDKFAQHLAAYKKKKIEAFWENICLQALETQYLDALEKQKEDVAEKKRLEDLETKSLKQENLQDLDNLEKEQESQNLNSWEHLQ